MKFFLDSANINEIEAAVGLGVIAGVTTNPSLIAQEQRDIKAVVQEIAKLVTGPVSAEVIGQTHDEMVSEARELAALAPNIIIKIPITVEGLKAVHTLHKAGIRTNVTLIFSANQALLAARAGASFVSPFVGRLDDISEDGVGLVQAIAEIFSLHNITTEIIAASIRNPAHVTQVALAGADIATVPYKVLVALVNHPLTDAGITRFLADWQAATGA